MPIRSKANKIPHLEVRRLTRLKVGVSKDRRLGFEEDQMQWFLGFLRRTKAVAGMKNEGRMAVARCRMKVVVPGFIRRMKARAG